MIRARRARISTKTPSRFPYWKRDSARIEAEARKIWKIYGGPTPIDAFISTRNTLISLWPDLPWPHTQAEQERVPTPGAPGVFEQRWVVISGPTGNAMKAVWDSTIEYVYSLMGRYHEEI
jgi:hypothetical protein